MARAQMRLARDWGEKVVMEGLEASSSSLRMRGSEEVGEEEEEEGEGEEEATVTKEVEMEVGEEEGEIESLSLAMATAIETRP